MPAITRSEMGYLLEAGLRADFFEAYRRQVEGAIYPRIATVIQTELPVQKYGWLGSVPAMREFVDERMPRGLRVVNYTIQDTVWESTIAVERRALEDEQIGAIRLRVQDLGREAARHKDYLVVKALLDGFTQPCYDGQPLFSSTHSEGDSGLQSNTTTQPLGPDSLQSAISAMMLFKDDQGVSLGILPDTLVVGPRLRWTAMELLESQVVVVKGGTGDSTPYRNVLQGALQLVVSPYITGNQWFVLDTSRAVRAVILQERSDVLVEFSALEDPSVSESVFLRDVVYYGARARYGVGYGLWQTAYGSNAS
ncbi:MAG: Mu-like prophage major head subunit gpT family protein [Chthonomonadetes bacterium]|nr:Mu-like prophage major head subunit gpT family protein [Chthonomonadetes bacterium]